LIFLAFFHLVQNSCSKLPFRQERQFENRTASAHDQRPVRVCAKSGCRYPDLVGNDEIEFLLLQFPSRVRLQVLGLGGEADKDAVSLFFSQCQQDVLGAFQRDR